MSSYKIVDDSYGKDVCSDVIYFAYEFLMNRHD